LCKGLFEQKNNQAVYNTAKELYLLIKNEKDEKSLGFIIEAAGWLRLIL